MARYELADSGGISAPLLVSSYWKVNAEQTDIRIDYRLNTLSSPSADGAAAVASSEKQSVDASPFTATIKNSPLLNIIFSTAIDGAATLLNSDPAAKWIDEQQSLCWTLTELSKHGESNSK